MKNINIELIGSEEDTKLIINNEEFTEQEAMELINQIKEKITFLKAAKNHWIWVA